ncbi:hypothetical protein [Mesorhizobium sp.]|uniref:hypothetical protein n=1 Tax=Mesorhizobium sp. TaxID=1871066 RepID=UPI000FE9CB8F|nr:hypothetical protein [Mesorhizobium sp.]RWD70777.1 MAG: hypothetical protein EOS37_13610 [Mesorhizobium sp.]TIV55778.1 MAG: hypothetical protein E5V80_29255 [Mesorhizobium sp.]
MNRWLEAIFSVVPTAALGWAAQWAAVFEKTYFLPYNEPEKVVSTGVAAGSVLAVIVGILCRNLRAQTVGFASLSMLAITILLWVGCFAVRIRLQYPATRGLTETLGSTWQIGACLFIITVLMAILFAIMFGLTSTFDEKPEGQAGS